MKKKEADSNYNINENVNTKKSIIISKITNLTPLIKITILVFLALTLILVFLLVKNSLFNNIGKVVYGLYGLFTLIVTLKPSILNPLLDFLLMRHNIKKPSKEWKKLYKNVIKQAYKNVEDEKEAIRENQILEITISKYRDENIKAIIVTRTHEYIIYNPYTDKEHPYNIEMPADLGTRKNLPDNKVKEMRMIDSSKSFSDLDKCGGFLKMEFIINDAEPLIINGKDLLISARSNYRGYKIDIEQNDTKVKFFKNVTIPKEGKIKCIFHTFGVYHFRDKLQWEFNEFCNGLDMSVIKYVKFKNLQYRFNHHERKLIEEADSIYSDEKDKININRPIFPYQGFEIRWEAEKNEN